MSTTPRFNKRTIESLKPPATGEVTIKDDKVSGLSVRVRPSGATAFYLLKRHKGRLVRLKLGDFPTMSVENARKSAIAAIRQFNDGSNPADTRRAERGEMTIGDLWAVYRREHVEVRCSKRTAASELRLYDKHLDALANRKLSDLTPANCKALHNRIGKDARISANRAIQLLRRLYRYAARHHGYEGKTPTVGVELFREQSRERFLSTDELPAFLTACDVEGQPWADFFRLCIYTGARRSNVQAMQWDHIDAKARTWTIPADQSKNGRDMTLTLPTPAVDILTRRKAERAESKNERIQQSPYVFPVLRDKGKSAYLSQPARPFERIIKRAGITGVRIHDLRRTAGAWMAASGATLPMIGKALGHQDLRATQIYARLDLAPVRAAVDLSVSAMTEAVTKAATTKDADQ